MTGEHYLLLGQLRWRSRRGLRELDMVLQRYLEQRYPQASPQEQAAYVELLEQNDADILDWLLGRKPAPEHLTNVIRSLSPGR
ncbi:MAG: succinate dehydrogenase assembly factor 2 [Gammaproteobacteria bacterium]